MTAPAPSGGPVRPAVAVALATVGFIALVIFGLGMTSLVTGQDIIATPGLGQIPGVAAFVCAALAFVAGLAAAVRMQRPSYWGAAWTAAGTFLAYLGGLWVAAIVTGADLAAATAVTGRIATSWFGAVIAATALVSAWAGIALVRTRARRPRWPWEDEFDE